MAHRNKQKVMKIITPYAQALERIKELEGNLEYYEKQALNYLVVRELAQFGPVKDKPSIGALVPLSNTFSTEPMAIQMDKAMEEVVETLAELNTQLKAKNEDPPFVDKVYHVVRFLWDRNFKSHQAMMDSLIAKHAELTPEGSDLQLVQSQGAQDAGLGLAADSTDTASTSAGEANEFPGTDSLPFTVEPATCDSRAIDETGSAASPGTGDDDGPNEVRSEDLVGAGDSTQDEAT